MRTLTFGFVVGTDFHHYLFAFCFCGEGWVPGVREGGGVERRGEVEAQKGEEKRKFHGDGDIHLDF